MMITSMVGMAGQWSVMFQYHWYICVKFYAFCIGFPCFLKKPIIYIKMKSDWQMYDTKERIVLPGKKRGSVVYVRKVNNGERGITYGKTKYVRTGGDWETLNKAMKVKKGGLPPATPVCDLNNYQRVYNGESDGYQNYTYTKDTNNPRTQKECPDIKPSSSVVHNCNNKNTKCCEWFLSGTNKSTLYTTLVEAQERQKKTI